MTTNATAVPDTIVPQAENLPVVSDTTTEKTTDPVEATGPVQNEPITAPAEKTDASLSITPVQQLWNTARASGHPEIWGVTLADPSSHVPSQIIFQKYLNANDGDLAKAEDQLKKTLAWRAEIKPLELLTKKFNKAKFENLGYVTSYSAGARETVADPESKEVFTWNIYGRVKSIEETFGDQKEFLEWRTALMEQGIHELDIAAATKRITAEYDPYKIFQIHDYKSISFLRPPSQVKAASQETIKVFAQNYPELLKEKFFVNVPAVFGFVYTFMKLFVAAKTIKKFHPMSNGAGLVHEFGESKVTGLGTMLPIEYGGKGEDLASAGTGPALE